MKLIDSTNLAYLWGKIKNLVSTSVSGKANLASPNFTGTPTAPTATTGTSTNQIATTAFVQTELNNFITWNGIQTVLIWNQGL
jgi:hypothetical protein